MVHGKGLGTDNPADLMTESLAADMIEPHWAKLAVTRPRGRADKVPNLSLFIPNAVWQAPFGKKLSSIQKKEKKKIG